MDRTQFRYGDQCLNTFHKASTAYNEIEKFSLLGLQKKILRGFS